MLWWAFQNPTGGFEGVAKTGRNYRSPLFTFLTSTAFWFTAAYLIADGADGLDFGSSSSSGGLVKPGSSYSAPASPARPSTATTTKASATASNAPNSSGDSACEKAKKAAATANTIDELELAKAKVEALC
jgi:hypothetical protein